MNITTMTFAARDFSARRGASDEHTLRGSGRSEQRSLAEKELPPEGLRRIWPVAALLVGHRSTSGYAPSSRLAPGQIRCNERHRSYVHDHLDKTKSQREQSCSSPHPAPGCEWGDVSADAFGFWRGPTRGGTQPVHRLPSPDSPYKTTLLRPRALAW